LGGVYNRQGKQEEALGAHSKALEIWLKVFGDVHPEVARTKHIMGLVLKSTGKASEARAMFAEAAAVLLAVLGPDHPDTKESERLAAE
jgi:hypothetical protein